MIDCANCFGCIGLKNKQFCIFNKQYEKDERYDEVDKLMAIMESEWDLGKTFPSYMNPFYFNDTVSTLVEDFEKEEIIKQWYLRREWEIKVDIPENMEVVHVDDLHKYESRSDVTPSFKKGWLSAAKTG